MPQVINYKNIFVFTIKGMLPKRTNKYYIRLVYYKIPVYFMGQYIQVWQTHGMVYEIFVFAVKLRFVYLIRCICYDSVGLSHYIIQFMHLYGALYVNVNHVWDYTRPSLTPWLFSPTPSKLYMSDFQLAFNNLGLYYIVQHSIIIIKSNIRRVLMLFSYRRK